MTTPSSRFARSRRGTGRWGVALVAGLVGVSTVAFPAWATDAPTPTEVTETTETTTPLPTGPTTVPTTATTPSTQPPTTRPPTTRPPVTSATTAPSTSNAPTTAPVGSGPTTTPTTSATTAPKMPAPAPFPFPLDFGNRAVAAKGKATKALRDADERIERFSTRERGLARRRATLERRRDAFGSAYSVAARNLEQTQRRIETMVAELYKSGASPGTIGALEAWRSADDVVSAQRGITLLDRSRDSQDSLLADYRRSRSQAAGRVQQVVDSLAYVTRESDKNDALLADARRDRTKAVAARRAAERDLREFFDAATTSASPVMGPSRLTAKQLVRFVRANKKIVNTTVPLDALARYFIEEGADEGVRGDVAFAQALLETGWFGLGNSGLVTKDDNNFAGIGACDTCDRGFTFESARIGVRAQMQLLRVYADPELKNYEFNHPVVYSRLRAPLGGRNPTWYSLEGRWATARNYGIHVYNLYMRMVEFSEASR